MIPLPKQMRVFKKRFWMTSRVDYQRNADLPEMIFRYLVSDLDAFYHNLIDVGYLDDDPPEVIQTRPFNKKCMTISWWTPGHQIIESQTVSSTPCRPEAASFEILLHRRWLASPATCLLEIRAGPAIPGGDCILRSRHFLISSSLKRYLDWMACRTEQISASFRRPGWRLESKIPPPARGRRLAQRG